MPLTVLLSDSRWQSGRQRRRGTRDLLREFNAVTSRPIRTKRRSKEAGSLTHRLNLAAPEAAQLLVSGAMFFNLLYYNHSHFTAWTAQCNVRLELKGDSFPVTTEPLGPGLKWDSMVWWGDEKGMMGLAIKTQIAIDISMV